MPDNSPRSNATVDVNGRRRFIVVVKKAPADYDDDDRKFFRDYVDLEEHAWMPSFNSEDNDESIIGANAIYSMRLNEDEFNEVVKFKNLVTLSEVVIYNPFKSKMGVEDVGAPS